MNENKSFFMSGTPVGFSNSGEPLWKEKLEEQIPDNVDYVFHSGIKIDFSLESFQTRNQWRDLDNLLDPVFSVVINNKDYLNGGRKNIEWFNASMREKQPTGCNIGLFTELPENLPFHEKEIIFKRKYMGHLPKSARESSLINWAKENTKGNIGCTKMKYDSLLSFNMENRI